MAADDEPIITNVAEAAELRLLVSKVSDSGGAYATTCFRRFKQIVSHLCCLQVHRTALPSLVPKAREGQVHRHLLVLPRFQQNNSLLCCLQLEKYQEQSQLLDPCLEGIIVPLSQLLRKQAVASTADLELTNALCRMLMVAANVRCLRAMNLLQLPLCQAHRQWDSACTA